MKKEVIYLFALFVLSLLITNVLAVDILKPAKVNANYTIMQTCASCTYVNVTISNVDGIVISDQSMINNGSGVWIYDITPTVVSRHDVAGQGDLNGVDTSFATFFDVTPSGKILSEGDSRMYTLFTMILFGAILIISFFVFTMPSKNERDEEGFETGILKIKYVRVFFIALIYPLIILLLNFLNGLAVNFTALSLFSGILGFLFETLLRLSWPFTIIIFGWIIFMLVHDTNVKKQLDRFAKFNPHNP